MSITRDSVVIDGFLYCDSVVTLTTTYADDVFEDDYQYLDIKEKKIFYKEVRFAADWLTVL
jgi:hypothetical protein